MKWLTRGRMSKQCLTAVQGNDSCHRRTTTYESQIQQIPIWRRRRPKTLQAASANTPQNPQYPIRPVNVNHAYTSSNPTNPAPPAVVNTVAPIAAINPQTLRAPTSFPQELPFSLSRSFMIDYMWHHQQQTSSSVNAPTAANKANHFQFPPYSALNWIKQPPPSFLFKPGGGSMTSIAPSSDEKPPPAFNHFHSAFKPVINMRLNDEANAIAIPNTQSPASSTTSSNYNHTTASSANQSDDEPLTPVKKSLSRRKSLRGKEVDYYVDVDETSSHGEHKMCVSMEDGGGSFDGDAKDQMTSDDENEMVDIETTEDDIQILNLQPFKVSHHSGRCDEEHEEEIEVSDEKFTQLENNNNEQEVKSIKHPKSPIKSLKEIVNRSESEEYFVTKRNSIQRTSPHYHEWTLNLKKEVRENSILYCLIGKMENLKMNVQHHLILEDLALFFLLSPSPAQTLSG